MAGKPRILIVDDDRITQETLAAIMFPDGYDIAYALNSMEALNQLERFNIDTILLDVLMPDMDGFELCCHIKKDERWRHIPIIMVTGLDSKEDLSQGLDAGADDFVHKPVNSIELRARVRSMLRIKKQFDELEETLQLRDDLSNMIIHDMKSPLGAIMMISQLLQLRTNSPHDLKDLGLIQAQVRRLEAFINDILLMAKMKEGRLILSRSTVDLNGFIKNIGRDYKMAGKAREIDFVLDLPERSAQVSIDVNLFHRVIDNLISNALKFSPNESVVRLCVEYTDTDTEGRRHKDTKAEGHGTGTDIESGKPVVRLKVIDQGHGVPEEHREDIFDKFKVAFFPDKNIKQVGLGLAFCKMVVEAHGGRIFVCPNEPQGLVFTVEI